MPYLHNAAQYAGLWLRWKVEVEHFNAKLGGLLAANGLTSEPIDVDSGRVSCFLGVHAHKRLHKRWIGIQKVRLAEEEIAT